MGFISTTISPVKHKKISEKRAEVFMERSVRYAVILERLISHEGTYPPIGRSLAYRIGAFQTLSQMALMKKLPEKVKPAQVRCALTTLIKNQMNAPDTFDDKGWLRIGLYASQLCAGETYKYNMYGKSIFMFRRVTSFGITGF
jgi:hypothetical protein